MYAGQNLASLLSQQLALARGGGDEEARQRWHDVDDGCSQAVPHEVIGADAHRSLMRALADSVQVRSRCSRIV